MKVISREEALQGLTDLVTELGPDYQYTRESCVYATPDGPSCGVGMLLFRLGVPFDVLADMDNGEDSSSWDSSIDSFHSQSLLSNAGFEFGEGVVPLLSRFQGEQDRRERYGKCLKLAQEA